MQVLDTDAFPAMLRGILEDHQAALAAKAKQEADHQRVLAERQTRFRQDLAHVLTETVRVANLVLRPNRLELRRCEIGGLHDPLNVHAFRLDPLTSLAWIGFIYCEGEAQDIAIKTNMNFTPRISGCTVAECRRDLVEAVIADFVASVLKTQRG